MTENCSVNCSDGENWTQDTELCKAFDLFDVENVPRSIIVLNCSANTILVIVSILANILVVSAVWRTPSLRYPSIVFLCGLAVSDLAVGFVVQPLFIAVELLKIHGLPSGGDCTLERAYLTLAYLVCGVSFGLVTLISVDRYIAIQYPLRYTSIVTLPRVFFLITLCWLAGIFCASLFVWQFSAFLFVVATVMIVFLGTSTIIHIIIYRIVRRHRNEIRAQEQAVQATNEFNMARFKKTAVNTFIVYYFLLLCYVPFSIAWVLRITGSSSLENPIVWKLGTTIVFLNSALNPFLYCWRVPTIRGPVMTLLKKIFCRWKITGVYGNHK